MPIHDDKVSVRLQHIAHSLRQSQTAQLKNKPRAQLALGARVLTNDRLLLDTGAGGNSIIQRAFDLGL
jgi:hypothetical protein